MKFIVHGPGPKILGWGVYGLVDVNLIKINKIIADITKQESVKDLILN